MSAAIYLRVSTEEQRERQSIATQRDFAERYCSLHEISVADFYADDGVTGTMPLDQRPEGARLLAGAKAKEFDAVLIYKLDRLGRDPRLILNAVKELEDLGAEVKSMTEPFDTASPSGRFLLTILSGVAGLERDTIVQRSAEGTNRLARAGVWLGGVVPYGYRAEGKRKEARLVVCEDPLPGTGLTEAGVIRLIFHLAGDESWSCMAIAEHLSALGVPPAYLRPGREVLRGKRKQATAGVWWPGRVRNLLVSTTYRGLHQYGKRAVRPRDLIERPVPAIVDADLWGRAQQTLRRNFLFCRRNARRRYLLRGLMKCAHCGMSCVGTAYPMRSGGKKVYYVCCGKHQRRRVLGPNAPLCPSKAIPGDIEDVVWRDVEGFLRNPGPVLKTLHGRLRQSAEDTGKAAAEIERLGAALGGKDGERDAVVGLFRRGRIDEAALDRQLDDLERERVHLQAKIRDLEEREERAKEAQGQLTTIQALLGELHRRLDPPLTWETKRQLVELLVEGARVEVTQGNGDRPEPLVTVTYRFDVPGLSTETRTPARAASSAIRGAPAAARRP